MIKNIIIVNINIYLTNLSSFVSLSSRLCLFSLLDAITSFLFVELFTEDIA